MDNRNFDGILWYETKKGYWHNRKIGLQHDYIWRQINGEIPEGYIVHHSNEDKSDNRMENLQLMTSVDHTKLHHIGKTVSEETRKKMSEANKGKKHSEEWKEKNRIVHLGKTHSEETKIKMSEVKKGKPPNNKGKKASDEARKNMSEAKSGEKHPMFGKRHSEETKEKMRNAWIKRRIA